MKLEMTKSFNSKTIRKNYIVYSNVKLNSTEIFKKLSRVLCYMHEDMPFVFVKRDIEETIRYVKKENKIKSKCRIEYYNDRIEIFKEDKYIFPEILITKINYENR